MPSFIQCNDAELQQLILCHYSLRQWVWHFSLDEATVNHFLKSLIWDVPSVKYSLHLLDQPSSVLEGPRLSWPVLHPACQKRLVYICRVVWPHLAFFPLCIWGHPHAPALQLPSVIWSLMKKTRHYTTLPKISSPSGTVSKTLFSSHTRMKQWLLCL